MLALERRNLILEKLQAEKRVVVSELSQLYDVSEETIRRDLDKLEKEGLAIKSYGGAVINEDVSIDLPFNVRKNQNVTGKQKMAELAASLVKDGDHIFLDASTTAVFVAKALKEKERLTVITNSMEILLELADVSGWNIISTGGVMKEGYLAFLGSKTDESIRSYYVDKVIFSCKALDLESFSSLIMEPSCIVTTRFFIAFTISLLCVTTRTVVPLSLICSRSFMISSEVFGSRFPVGSSARRISGRLTSALASATLCCSPPESSSGKDLYLTASPTS